MRVDVSDLGVRIAAPEIKSRLHELTAAAVARGVFGVPTFVVGHELFWGHDRMTHLAEHLAGRGPKLGPRPHGFGDA